MFTFFMKHVKFQVPRQSQCEPGPGLAEREREGGESAETSRQRRVLTPTLQHSTSSRTTTRTVIRMLLMQDRVLGETVGD